MSHFGACQIPYQEQKKAGLLALFWLFPFSINFQLIDYSRLTCYSWPSFGKGGVLINDQYIQYQLE
jgi:hypothetical protein